MRRRKHSPSHPPPFPSPPRAPPSLAPNQDSRYLATGSYDAKLRIFDLQRPSAEPVIVDHAPLVAKGASSTASRLKKVVWSAHGGLIFTGDDGGVVRAWDVAQLKCVRELHLAPGSANGVMDIEQSADGASLLVAAGTKAHLIDVASFTARAVVDMGPGGDVETASLHCSGRWAIVGGADTYVRIFDLYKAGSPPAAEMRGHHGKVHCLRFSHDGSFFVSGADDATVRKWDLEKALALGAQKPGQEPGQGNVVGSAAAFGGGGGGGGGSGGGGGGGGGGDAALLFRRGRPLTTHYVGARPAADDFNSSEGDAPLPASEARKRKRV